MLLGERDPIELSAPVRYMLVELEASGTPWELARMTYEEYPRRGEGYVVGPGVVTENAAEQLEMAQTAAAELLRRGLIEVRQGADWCEEGLAVTDVDVAALVSDPMTWKWPNQPERDSYTWFVLTPAGEEAAEIVSLDDIPKRRLPPPGFVERIGAAVGKTEIRFLLRLSDWLAQIQSRLGKPH